MAELARRKTCRGHAGLLAPSGDGTARATSGADGRRRRLEKELVEIHRQGAHEIGDILDVVGIVDFDDHASARDIPMGAVLPDVGRHAVPALAKHQAFVSSGFVASGE